MFSRWMILILFGLFCSTHPTFAQEDEIKSTMGCQNHLIKTNIVLLPNLENQTLKNELSRSERNKISKMKNSGLFKEWDSLPSGALIRVENEDIYFTKVETSPSDAGFILGEKQYLVPLDEKAITYRDSGGSTSIALKSEVKAESQVIKETASAFVRGFKSKAVKRFYIAVLAIGLAGGGGYKFYENHKINVQHEQELLLEHLKGLLDSDINSTLKNRELLKMVTDIEVGKISPEIYENLLNKLPPDSSEGNWSSEYINDLNDHSSRNWQNSYEPYQIHIIYQATKRLIKNSEYLKTDFKQRMNLYKKVEPYFQFLQSISRLEYQNDVKQFFYQLIVNGK